MAIKVGQKEKDDFTDHRTEKQTIKRNKSKFDMLINYFSSLPILLY